MIRRALLGAVLATAVGIVGCAGTPPASADDAGPAATPPPVPDPSSGTPGPTYVITPGVGGSELPPPSDPDEVEKAKREDRAREAAQSGSGPGTGSAPGPASKGSGPVPGAGAPMPAPGSLASEFMAGPQVPLVAGAEGSVSLLWRSIAGALVMLVMFEVTEVGRFLRGRRRVAAEA